MKRISVPTDYEPPYVNTSDLRQALRGFHNVSSFYTNWDLYYQYFEAVMTDEQAFIFAIQYPEYQHLLKDYNR